jgi:3-hydroxyacyl-CoA dehydrogenase/enoyl-CoA hydratase/3-hydroxybutyryl-CoA epimerase
MSSWTVDKDADGIVLVLFDVPDRPVNTLGDESIREFSAIVDRIAGDSTVKGVVIASGKPGTFCAGGEIGDLDTVVGPPPAGEEAVVLAADYARFSRENELFRKLETCGKPVAAAIEGVALGGGAELALACHYRVAADSPAVKIGFPEVTAGMHPGGGGTQRLPRLVGIQAALKLLLDGRPIKVEEAKKIGFLNALAPPGGTVEAAKQWIRGGGEAVQPWDKKGAKIPGGAPHAPGVSDIFAVSTAMIRKQQFGNYPAPMNILSAVYEGSQVPIDAALRIETRYFIKTMRSPQAKAMIRSLFQSPKEIKAGISRPAGLPKAEISKASVIGAGLMGAGIAYVQAKAGIVTTLLDRTQEAAEKGKDYARKVTAKAIARGEMTQAAADALLARILPTTDYADLAGSALVIEAVFEDRAVKAAVTREVERHISADAIIGSNTSTLPITGLAEPAARPENFIGLHFFSPVERMGLVEIIRGEKTSERTLATAMDYVGLLRKTPIVVRDARGFYTSRTIVKYSDEPCEMLLEGISPALIESIGRMIGMPMAPFTLADVIGLDLAYHVRQQTKADLGDAFVPTASDQVLEFLVERHGRLGLKNGKGFYDYSEDRKEKTLWRGLSELGKPKVLDAFDGAVQTELKNRLLYSMALEAARCVAEDVVADPREADVGALIGFGFPSWTGGPISLIDMVGTKAFVAECDRLAAAHGSRFSPPNMLRRMAEENRGFYDKPAVASPARAVA